MMNNFLEDIKSKILLYDGSKGYMLQKFGLVGGSSPESFNIENIEVVKKIYSMYRDAGSDVIQTNTFTGNEESLEKYNLLDRAHEINHVAAKVAKEVMGDRGYVAASIGPVGRLMEPLGDLSFESAYGLFSRQVTALADGGCDIINFETFTDLAEMRVALLAAKENTRLPVICSISFESGGRTLMGTDPETVVLVLKSLGADMVGTNCSFGPSKMVGITEALSKSNGGYISVKPNAGLPELYGEKSVYKDSREELSGLAETFASHGARLIGGCCGTTPENISHLRPEIDRLNGKIGEFNRVENMDFLKTKISSPTDTLDLSKDAGLMGIIDCKEDHIYGEVLESLSIVDFALDDDYTGGSTVKINIDRVISKTGDELLLGKVINEAQGYIKIPVILETCHPKALEYGLRVYKGRAGVSLIGNLRKETEEVAKRYNALIV